MGPREEDYEEVAEAGMPGGRCEDLRIPYEESDARTGMTPTAKHSPLNSNEPATLRR